MCSYGQMIAEANKEIGIRENQTNVAFKMLRNEEDLGKISEYTEL